jgi:hypothetical protein
MNLSSLPKVVELSDLQRARYGTALMALLTAARLPIVVTLDALKWGETQQIPVAVPPGFETLFKEIVIQVSFYASEKYPHARVSWQYRHPCGSNGHTIGMVGCDTESGEWEWSIDNGGPRGTVG